MPTPPRRLVLCLGALAVSLLLSSAGTGFAFAEPDTSSNSGEKGGSSETGPVSEPAPTAATPTEPKGLLGQLHDFLHRPIFGNGRVPGQPPTTILTAQGHPRSSVTTQGAPTDEPKAAPDEEPAPAKSDPSPVEESPAKPDPPPVEVPPGKPDPGNDSGPTEPAPVKKSAGSLANVVLPGAFTFSLPVPTFPGTSDLNWSFDLSNPASAYSSVQDNVAQLGALVQNVIAPFNPFPPPPPKPTLRILEEEPVVESTGGNAQPPEAGAPDLPVLQAPMALPAPRLGPPRPLTELVPAGASSEVLGVGTAGVRGPVRGSVMQGSVQAGEPAQGNTTSPMSNTAYRQGYPQYLRTARVVELATVALPGIAGLLAITASGGVIGYRQANSGRYVRADAARFLG